MKPFRSALGLIRGSRRPYLVINLAYYGLILCAMVYTAFDRSLQQLLMDSVAASLSEGPLATVADAYVGGSVLPAIGLTVGINLAVGSFVTITLPSLVIPFSGLLTAALRALIWGVLFSPQISGAIAVRDVLIGIMLLGLILLEGQGYVLAMFGAYLHGRSFLFSRPEGSGENRSRGIAPSWQGYLLGLKEQALIYLFVALVLLIAALYEVGLAMVAAPALYRQL